MKEIQLENLSSLKYLRLDFQSLEKVTLRNLLTLREFELVLEKPINSEILDKFLEILPNIECLKLVGKFSYFNLDNLLRLNKLSLNLSIIKKKEFNLDF